jgi:hypothetical protein
MPVRHKIERTLRKLGVVVRKKGEPDERFLDRAARACDVPVDEWNEFPVMVQEWANLALAALLANKPAPFFDVVETEKPKEEKPPPTVAEEPPPVEVEEPKEEPPAVAEKKEEPVARKPAKKAATKAARKPAKKVAKKALRKGPSYNPRKGANAHDQFRQMAIDNPTATRKELYAMAEKAKCGLTNPSMSACIYHVDAVLRVLRGRGFKVPEVARARSQRAAARKAAAKKATKKTARKPAKKAAKKTTKR